MKTVIAALGWIAIAGLPLPAQQPASTFVDENGVMRWTASRQEVVQFGVNYTTPFAYAFRAHQHLGIPWQQAIDADVYHLARLGLDAYRVHIWDREISDPAGNLVVNEHVQAFDYLLAKLEERGIKIVLTLMQFGDASFPEEVGPPLNGFSTRYGKAGCLEDRTSWPLQERYLAQLASHVNSRTGRAYKDDPDILAFEICNEPGHFEYGPTVEYINRMAKAVRDTGCAKPIFYNMSHGLPVFSAYLDAQVQGGTFQWYPSNLVAGHEQRGNFLPYVDDYPIPFAADPRFKRKAKMAYEFDTADIGRSYLYPAIARAFRRAGMQFATQFAYDPMYLAPFNTEYQTHYLNLAYAPQKALSMKIAAEAFRRVPLYHDYGPYPGNQAFAGVRVSYPEDLAELVTAQSYFYTNTTATPPPAPESLEHIAGYGSSPVIGYPGRGAYFLDRLEPGVWRLEVMPDAIWVRDPFERASPKKIVARIAWNEWPLKIDLPDLGPNFRATGLNDGNGFNGQATGDMLPVRPGVYLLTRNGVTTKWQRDDRYGNITLKEFVAPPASIDRTYVIHQPIGESTAGRNLRVSATVVSPREVKAVRLVAYFPQPPAQTDETDPGQRIQPGGGNGPGPGVRNTGGAEIFPMQHLPGFDYAAEIPGEQVKAGVLRYYLAVQGPEGEESFPGAAPGLPTDWDFVGKPWTARIVPAGSPILMFDAATDTSLVTADRRDQHYNLVPSDRPGVLAMRVVAQGLARGEHDYSFRFFFRDKVAARAAELGAADKIVAYGRSATDKPCDVQLALITADGIAYGGRVTFQPGFGAYSVPVRALRKVRAPNIPHGYPVFIHFWSWTDAAIPLDMRRAESVLVSIGPGLSAAELGATQAIEIERIWMESPSDRQARSP